MASTISELAEDGSEVKCACVSAGGNTGYYYDTPHANLYGIERENDDEADPDAEARRIRIDEVKAAIASASASHLAWFNAHLEEFDLMPNVMGIVEDYALSGYDGIGRIVDDYEKTAGAEVDRRFCPMLAVYGWSKASLRNELPEWIASYLVDGELPFNYVDRAKTFIGWLAAFESDGYEPTPADLELKRLCEAALGKCEEEEEE